MRLKWTFSTHRCFRRCQRQYFFREIAASHNARNALRREAFILKQAKGLDLWRGLLVHGAIESQVIPRLEENVPIPWDEVMNKTLAAAHLQFDFSASAKHREEGMTKSKAGDAYCVLLPHLRGEDVSTEEFERVLAETQLALRNLAGMEELWRRITGRGRYWAELPVCVAYAGARVEARIDLLCFRGPGKPIVVEWKTYAGDTGGDARLQTAVYAWVLCRHKKWAIKNAADVELLEAQLLSGKLIEHRCDDRSFEELEDLIYRGIGEMQALVGEKQYADQVLHDFAFARSPSMCVYCAFRELCIGTQTTAVEAHQAATTAQGMLF